MAARYNLRQNDACRGKIQTTQLLKRLSDHIFNGLELSATQLRAIEIQLDRVLPKLASVEHTGDGLRPYAVIPDTIADPVQWSEAFTPKPKVEH